MADNNNTVTRQEKVILQNPHGEKLVGVLHDNGSADVVVLCHGTQSSKDYRLIVNLSAALEIKGISSFRFDFAGDGESEGSFDFGNYWRQVEDLRSVTEYFSAGSNRRNIAAIVGHSRGGMVALLYASKYHDVSTVVSLSARYKVPTKIPNHFLEKINMQGLTEESLVARLSVNMHDPCLQIDPNCRVLSVIGSADEFIPVEDAMEYGKIIPNHTFSIIEGAGHVYDSHQDELVHAVLPFIEEGLQGLHKIH